MTPGGLENGAAGGGGKKDPAGVKKIQPRGWEIEPVRAKKLGPRAPVLVPIFGTILVPNLGTIFGPRGQEKPSPWGAILVPVLLHFWSQIALGHSS